MNHKINSKAIKIDFIYSKKIEENMSMRGEMEKVKKDLNQTSRDEKSMLKIKYSSDGINSRLNTAEEKTSEFEGIPI